MMRIKTLFGIILFCVSTTSYGYPVVVIGRSDLVTSLKEAHLLESNQSLDITLMGSNFFPEAEHFFIRDMLIQRLDGTVLIPRSPKNIGSILTPIQLRSYLPFEEKKFIKSLSAGYGDFGLRKESRLYAEAFAKEKGLQTVLSQDTALEGGNVFLVPALNKAIVGIHSIALTLIVQEEDQKAVDPQSPSLHAITIARNRDILEQMNTIGVKKEKFSADITEEDKQQYTEAAQIWEGKLARAKSSIAADLGLRIEDITFVVQQNYHLDLDLAVSPEGSVFQSSATDPDAAKIQRQQLEEAGWKVYSIQDIEEKDQGQMNGIFINKKFITFNPASPQFEAALRNENFSIEVLPAFSGFVKKYGGGLHCLTLELNLKMK